MNSKHSKEEERDLKGRLGQHGLRVTAQRIKVLRALEGEHDPISHGELANKLALSGMDRATVYRNLKTLVESKMVSRTMISDGVFRFELVRAEGRAHPQHPHLLCSDCGQVKCLPLRSVHVKAGLGDVTDIQLRGRCQACLKR